MADQKITRLILLLLPLLLLAAVLRFWNLNSLPIFADESIYVRWAQVMRVEPTLRFLPMTDGKQPLYMWVVIPFFKIISDPLIAGRIVSGLAGIGTVLGIGCACWILFKNKNQTFMAMTIATVMPYLVFFDRMALSDSLLTLFLVWTFNFSLLSLIHHRWDLSMLAGFTLGFAWLTKSPAMMAFGLIPLGLLFSKWHVKLIGFIFTTYIIAFGMYNILRLGPEFQQIALRNKDYVFSLSEVLRHPTDPLIPHLKDSWQFGLYFLTPIGLMLIVFGIFIGGIKEHWKPRIILLAWGIGPVVIESFIAKQFTARYLLFTVPFIVLLISYAIEHLGNWLMASLIIIPALFIDYLILFDIQKMPLPRIERSGYLEEWTAGFGLKEIAKYIQEKPGNIVVGSEGFFGTPFNALELYLNDYKNIRIVGVGVWVDKVHEKLANALDLNTVYLIVNSERFHIAEPEKIGLKLLASYPKGIKPNGQINYTLFFQVIK